MSLQPVALYGLSIPPGGHLVPAMQEDSFPDASFRITMAAIDPTEPPEADDDGNIPAVPRSTLRIVRRSMADLDDELDDEYLEQLMGGSDSEDDDEDDDEDEEANGGPSDPSKSKKAKQAAALKKLLESTKGEDSDEEMEDETDGKPNGVAKAKKGKEPATESDEEDEDDDESDDEDLELEDFVVCTLDTERNYQQTLDITVGPNEQVFFVSNGTHTIHLTGNYVIDMNESEDEDDEDDDEDDYDLDGLDDELSEGDSEEDELDDIENPRVTEVDTDDEEAPKLIEAKPTKGKNKRSAEEAEGLDEMIAKAADEGKLSKKQQKKLKNNQGDAVAVEEKAKDTTPKSDKKVQFAKNLEQGPTGSAASGSKTTLGVKVVQGVTVDDRKLGSGRTVKKGDKVEVRYIGKLQDGKVFDSNKKGKPFSFSCGKGEVIKGWDIGVVGMSVGGERRLTIPANLAYGSKSQPGIPGNSTLVFDIKLLGIK